MTKLFLPVSVSNTQYKYIYALSGNRKKISCVYVSMECQNMGERLCRVEDIVLLNLTILSPPSISSK